MGAKNKSKTRDTKDGNVIRNPKLTVWSPQFEAIPCSLLPEVLLLQNEDAQNITISPCEDNPKIENVHSNFGQYSKNSNLTKDSQVISKNGTTKICKVAQNSADEKDAEMAECDGNTPNSSQKQVSLNLNISECDYKPKFKTVVYDLNSVWKAINLNIDTTHEICFSLNSERKLVIKQIKKWEDDTVEPASHSYKTRRPENYNISDAKNKVGFQKTEENPIFDDLNLDHYDSIFHSDKKENLFSLFGYTKSEIEEGLMSL